MTQLKWSANDILRAQAQRCALHDLRSDGVRAKASTLGVVASFNSDGSGQAELMPLCRQCALEDNAICCEQVPT
jgi:hypothetical protein